MQCAVCGQEYGITHACAGIAALATPEETAPPPKLRFAPGFYLNEASKILIWDDEAVRRASRDNNSILYGLMIVAIAVAIPFVSLLLKNASLGYAAPWKLIAPRYFGALMFSLLWMCLQIGLAHLLAKTFFQARGSFVGLIRPYFLGQIYQWLVIVPIVGGLIVGIGGIALLMMVFEEVDGTGRMKAFGLAMVIGVTFWVLMMWGLSNAPPHRFFPLN